MRWSWIVSATVIMATAIVGVGRCEDVVSRPALDIARLVDQLGDEHVRDAAASRLGKAGPSAIPALSSVLDRKDDAWPKRAAIKALSKIATPESASAIKKGLTDADRDVRITALRELVDLGWGKNVIDRMEYWETARAFLLDDDSDTRRIAGVCLFEMNQMKSVPLLLDALDRELKMPREKRRTRTEPGVLLGDPDEVNINVYQSCLGTVADKSCIPIIEAYIGKGNKDMDYCLATALIWRDRTCIHKELLIDGATKCSVSSTRIMIIHELWQVDDPRVEGILKEALSDPYTSANPMIVKYPIRVNAKQSLEKLEMKKQGRDPLAEEAAKLLKSIQEQQKHSAEQHAMPPPPEYQK